MVGDPLTRQSAPTMTAEYSQKDAISMAELMKAMKLVKKAQEKNINLNSSSASNESLLLEKLSKIEKTQSGRGVAGYCHLLRWSLYVLLWVVGVVYLVALNHRASLCQMLEP